LSWKQQEPGATICQSESFHLREWLCAGVLVAQVSFAASREASAEGPAARSLGHYQPGLRLQQRGACSTSPFSRSPSSPLPPFGDRPYSKRGFLVVDLRCDARVQEKDLQKPCSD